MSGLFWILSWYWATQPLPDYLQIIRVSGAKNLIFALIVINLGLAIVVLGTGLYGRFPIRTTIMYTLCTAIGGFMVAG